MPPTFIDARNLAGRLDVGYDTVLTWVRRGKIPHIRDGRGRLLFNLFRSLFKTPTIAELVLKPAGKLIGSAGKSAGVRFLEGGLPAAQKLMGRLLSRGATRLTPVGSVAEKFALKEGGTVALRTVSSTPGVVATIDIDVADVEIHEIKFVAGAVP